MSLVTERLYLDATAEAAPAPERSLRSRLLTAARARRDPAVVTTGFCAPYAGRIAAMDALLRSASGDDWSRTIVEGWNLQELLAHLMATDSLLAASVGAPVAGPPLSAGEAPDRTNETLARTAEMLSYQRGRSQGQTRADWREQADAICRRVLAMDPSREVDPGGMSLPVADHLLARMLETWIHTDDAARTFGLRLPRPVPGHVHSVAGLCARLVPWTMLLSGLDASGATIRLTMTGPGGGSWHIPLDVTLPVTPAQAPLSDVSASDVSVDAEITCEVVDLCFLFGGRRDPESFPAELGGDQALARDILTVAPALSGP